MLKKIKIIIFKQLIFFFSLFIGNKNGYWIISLIDGGGSQVAENCLNFAFFLKKKKIKFKCISNKKIKGLRAYIIKPLTIEYFFYNLFSKVLITESDLHNDIPAYRSRNTIKINLFHGMASKKIYHSSKFIKNIFKKNLYNKIKKILLGFCFTDEYDLITVTNDFFLKNYRKAFLNQNVKILGMPRDDFLMDKKNSLIFKKKIHKKLNIKLSKKIILYLPTFRDKSVQAKNELEFLHSDKLNKILSKNNCIILFKNHFFTSQYNKRKKIKLSKNLIYLNDEFLTQELLKISDCLITDYSSVHIDYLLLNKPIIFYCYDIKRYVTNDRELNFNYNNDLFTPGKKIFNPKSLIKYLDQIITKHKITDKYKNYRILSKIFFFKYIDNKNSERVYNYIINNLLIKNN